MTTATDRTELLDRLHDAVSQLEDAALELLVRMAEQQAVPDSRN